MTSNRIRLAAAVLAAVLAAAAVGSRAASGPQAAEFTADGRLLFPKDYRAWVFLSSGLDMSYLQEAKPSAAPMFDNVFVDPAAYAAFEQTGMWPDRAVLVTEVRAGQQKGSINTRGHFQGERMAVEAHVKDTSHIKGGWGFFVFDGDGPARILPPSAACYACHQQHAAVDTTFVQFYPTLLPIAKAKGTLSPAYLREEAAQ